MWALIRGVEGMYLYFETFRHRARGISINANMEKEIEGLIRIVG